MFFPQVGHPEVVQLLLDAGADRDRQGGSGVHTEVSFGRIL